MQSETVTNSVEDHEPTTATGDLPRAVEHAYSSLRRAILSGELAAGTVLQEKDLAEQIGVSRTPIREALGWLRAEGLIVMERYRKHFVAHFDEKDRVEIFELRALLEGNLAARACRNLKGSQIDRLHVLCREMEDAIKSQGDAARPAFDALNREFHAIIWDAADSPRAQRLLTSSLSLPFNALGRYTGHLTATMERACWYHREIVSAFKARDEGRARIQMSAHVLSLITTAFE